MSDFIEETLPRFHAGVHDPVGNLYYFVYRNTPIEFAEASSLVARFMGTRIREFQEDAYQLASPIILIHQEDDQLIPAYLVTLEQQRIQQKENTERMERLRKRHRTQD